MIRLFLPSFLPIVFCVSQAQSQSMYWSDEVTQIVSQAGLDGSDVQNLISGFMPSKLGLALDDAAGKIYWAELQSGANLIRRANLDGSEAEDLVNTGDNVAEGIVLNPVDQHMYWSEFSVNFGASAIRRAGLDGSGAVDVVTNLVAPTGLALDLSGGKIYWAHSVGPHQMQRADLDGSNVEPLANPIVPFDVALDLAAGMVYWTDFQANVVQRAHLEIPQGETANTRTDIEDVLSDLNAPRGIALDVDAQHIYWTDLDGIHRADYDGSASVTLVPADLGIPGAIVLDFSAAACAANLECDDGNPCTSDLCVDNACDFPPRLFGDSNNDGLRNIVDVVCSARVTFQDATTCGDFEVSLDEIDIAPSVDCGNGELNITDVVAHARAAFQDAIDECCGP